MADVTAQDLQDQLTREQLNDLANSKGIENVDKLGNKGEVADAILDKGAVSQEELDGLTGNDSGDQPSTDTPAGDDGEGSDPKSVEANKEAADGNPASNPAAVDDLNTLHEPGSVRDGSIANENMEPTDEKHPDINADPGGRQATAGDGERLDDASNNADTPEQNAADGQATAERNNQEELNLQDASDSNATPRQSEQRTPGEVAAETAKANVAAEKAAAEKAGTLSPYAGE